MKKLVALAAVASIVGVAATASAMDRKNFHGTACETTFSTNAPVYNYDGISANNGAVTAWCPVVRDVTSNVNWQSVRVYVRDSSSSASVTCRMYVQDPFPSWGMWRSASSGTGFTGNRTLSISPQTASFSSNATYALNCTLPHGSSALHSYVIEER